MKSAKEERHDSACVLGRDERAANVPSTVGHNDSIVR